MNPVVRRARRRAAAARSYPGRISIGRLVPDGTTSYCYTALELRRRLGIPHYQVVIDLHTDGTGGRYTVVTVARERVEQLSRTIRTR